MNKNSEKFSDTNTEMWNFFLDIFNRKGAAGEWYEKSNQHLNDFESYEDMQKAFLDWQKDYFVEPGSVLENERATLIVVESEGDKVFCVGKFKNKDVDENPFGAWSFQKDGIEKVWRKTGKKVDLSKFFE